MCVCARYMCPCMCHYMYPWYVSLYAGERVPIARARALDLICVLICGLIHVSLYVALYMCAYMCPCMQVSEFLLLVRELLTNVDLERQEITWLFSHRCCVRVRACVFVCAYIYVSQHGNSVAGPKRNTMPANNSGRSQPRAIEPRYIQ